MKKEELEAHKKANKLFAKFTLDRMDDAIKSNDVFLLNVLAKRYYELVLDLDELIKTKIQDDDNGFSVHPS